MKQGSTLLATRKQTLSSQVSFEVRRAIVSGEIAPGDKINLDDLRRKYGISISPAREAVARLVGTGLVEFADQRGYQCSALSGAELEDIMDMRVALECIALETGILRATLEWESRLVGALHRLSKSTQAVASGHVKGEWIEIYAGFHLALVSNAGKPALIAAISSLLERFSRYATLATANPSWMHTVCEGAEHIVKCAIAKDGENACDALEKQLRTLGKALLDQPIRSDVLTWN